MGGYGLVSGFVSFVSVYICVQLKSVLEPNGNFWKARAHTEELTLSCSSGCTSASVQL